MTDLQPVSWASMELVELQFHDQEQRPPWCERSLYFLYLRFLRCCIKDSPTKRYSSHIVRQSSLFLGDQGKRTLFWSVHIIVNALSLASYRVPYICMIFANVKLPFAHMPLSPHIYLFSINGVGVDIAPFSDMPSEQEVLLLPGLPLVNRPGENPETDLWAFEVETPVDSPSVMIDYVHPGNKCTWRW